MQEQNVLENLLFTKEFATRKAMVNVNGKGKLVKK
jgi:hypothetical protein